MLAAVPLELGLFTSHEVCCKQLAAVPEQIQLKPHDSNAKATANNKITKNIKTEEFQPKKSPKKGTIHLNTQCYHAVPILKPYGYWVPHDRYPVSCSINILHLVCKTSGGRVPTISKCYSSAHMKWQHDDSFCVATVAPRGPYM